MKSCTIAVTAKSRNLLPRRCDLYLKAVAEAGGKTVVVFSDANVKDVAAKYDGFLIPGGRDIDPAQYGEDCVFPILPEDRKRTDFEISLLREIIGLRKPVLGICYGMQLMNVICGGNLYQDIALQTTGALDHTKGMHLVSMIANPYFGEGEAVTNSSHHQAVRMPGQGIRPFATTADGIVEGLFLENYPFFVGVQWHPERVALPLSALIFKRFVGACRADK